MNIYGTLLKVLFFFGAQYMGGGWAKLDSWKFNKFIFNGIGTNVL